MDSWDGAIVVSCEHAGDLIPAPYAHWFATDAARSALASHRGWDPGSLEIGEAFAGTLGAPLVVQRVSRLLVECNRSLDHPRLFSEFVRDATAEEREELITRYWRPHRERVRELVRDGVENEGRVVHVGVHTFTPVWKGRPRATDIGLLYDPWREPERTVNWRWRDAIRAALSDSLSGFHLNRPYRGWSDGLITTLRTEFSADAYVGIELEVSQGLVGDPRFAARLGRTLAHTLRSVLDRGS